MQNKDHWEKVYATKAPDSVSWFQPHADMSMRLIRSSGLGRDAAIIDVGGGASTLVDDLLNDDYTHVTVLDLSAAALAESRRRVGVHGASVTWVEADITRATFEPQSIDLWHDRAVFHFLTTAEDRATYVRQVLRALKPGGHVIMATFGSNGPTQCSGLPVMRYAPDQLHAEFGESFTMLAHEEQVHHTPFGTEQQFIYCMCRKQPT
ncbi:class I SAM-dependent methyltransferase [Aquabacterium sp. CECT 9606]|uniref:class I SAM-dependent methyltransferase n=1 Tax=Aquabacterium sp. CECT 9606 TaxID=2845822 RepID=UPI001E5EF7B7|nr:class I SAM-dependent methyltransferase [Aquabacterium sp. CECT 9606]CAH0353452.1 2-methoxy-6-polyprenyl-1,4-benzoquinol methylase, mitochondrial [Aquabacterium sp. CECT 9606]